MQSSALRTPALPNRDASCWTGAGEEALSEICRGAADREKSTMGTDKGRLNEGRQKVEERGARGDVDSASLPGGLQQRELTGIQTEGY